jgi:molybdenum cofactor biosynthesis enzyme MoaA
MRAPADAGRDPESRLLVTARDRDGSRLGQPALARHLAEPDLADLLTTLRARETSTVWLFGGEPTLRNDLPDLVREALSTLGRIVGLRTDGLAFRDQATAAKLVQAGLGAVRIRLHAGRLDAHDWLSGLPGSGARALRAIAAFRELGTRTEIEALVTRVNAPYLGELVRLAHEIGVSAVHFERLVLVPGLSDDAIALGARLGLTEPYLEDAATAAAALGVRVHFRGFPLCALGVAQAAAGANPTWLVPRVWSDLEFAEPAPPGVVRCGKCTSNCQGAPNDYLERFGAAEFFSEGLDERGVEPRSRAASSPTREPVQHPMGRGQHAPATRLRVVRGLAAATTHAVRFVAASPDGLRPAIRVRWRGESRLEESLADEPGFRGPERTRAIRQRLVRAAQYGASRLRVVGDALLTHPDLAELLAELRHLAMPELELCAEGSALAELPPASLAAFAGMRRVDLPLFGPSNERHNAHMRTPDAFSATLGGLERLAQTVSVPVTVFANLSNATSAREFAEAWASGALPGTPQFRLGADGGSLDELAAEVAHIDHEGSRRALASLLPHCLAESGGFEGLCDVLGLEFTSSPEPTAPSSCDRLGSFQPCRCGARGRGRCPGIATGWTSNRIEP